MDPDPGSFVHHSIYWWVFCFEGLALDRPKHTKRTPKPTLTEEDKKKYLAEAKRFAATLAKDLKEPEGIQMFLATR